MSEVKPPTDEEIATMPDRFAAPAEWGGGVTVDEAFSLLARIESDRAEIASVRKAAASKDRVIEQQAEEIARLKQAAREYEHYVMTGRDEQHERLVAERDRLKAEVERLTPPCRRCKGERTTTPTGNTPCPDCGGTGRAR